MRFTHKLHIGLLLWACMCLKLIKIFLTDGKLQINSSNFILSLLMKYSVYVLCTMKQRFRNDNKHEQCVCEEGGGQL